VNTQPFETIEGELGFTAKLYHDEDPESPRRDRDNLGIMVCFHHRYALGDKHALRLEDFLSTIVYDGWAGLEAHLRKEEGAIIVLPLYLYDHSGLRMKVGSFRGLLPQGHAEFDSGQVGFIYTTRKRIVENFMGKRLTKERLALAEEVLRGEVEEYDQYLSGDVWGFVIEDAEGEHIDSCWGFYGLDYARGEATRALGEALASIQNTEKGELV